MGKICKQKRGTKRDTLNPDTVFSLDACRRPFGDKFFFNVLEFIGPAQCFVRLYIDLWKVFEDVTIGMISFFSLNNIFERYKYISDVWECFSCSGCAKKENRRFFFQWQLSWSQCWRSCLQHVILETDYSEDFLFSLKSNIWSLNCCISSLEILKFNTDIGCWGVQP